MASLKRTSRTSNMTTLFTPFFTLTLLQLLGCFSYTSAFQIFPADSVTQFSASCAAALSTNITACSNVVVGLDPSETYDQSLLQSTCNATCGSALASWQNAVSSACGGATYLNDYGYDSLLSDVPGMMSFNFNQTCLMDGGLYCNVVLGNLTAAAANATNTTSTECNQCDLLLLRNTAESVYGDGPLILSEGLYQSFTSQCGYTGYPLTTQPAFPTSTA
jgi:hypothetical protein